MKTLPIPSFFKIATLALATLLASASDSSADPANALVDDFSDLQNSSRGVPRQFLADSSFGGGTTADHSVAEGILSVKGEIVPPRGQPGWASAVFLLDPQGQPHDLSAYEGVRLRVRVNRGNVSLSANSAEVENFDYHAAPIATRSDGAFHEVKIPFASLKRAWSEPTPLNTKAIYSLSVVAFDVQKGSFDFEIDEIGFY